MSDALLISHDSSVSDHVNALRVQHAGRVLCEQLSTQCDGQNNSKSTTNEHDQQITRLNDCSSDYCQLLRKRQPTLSASIQLAP